MRVLVIHDSKYGNGRKVAESIASGLEAEGHETEVCPMSGIYDQDHGDFGAFVIGTPTHVGGPTFRTRRGLKVLGRKCKGRPYTTFTTWMNIDQRTLEKMDHRANKLGLRKVMDGLAIKVEGWKGPLEEGYEERARDFGMEFGKRLREE